MLGKLLAESAGKRTLRRVLSTDPPTVEVNFDETGTILGAAASGSGTYTSSVEADGTLHGSGQGFLSTQDGEMVTWTGSGIGRIKEGGAVSYRGALFYKTRSQKLAALNNAIGVFEHEVDAEGKTQSKSWEWK